MSKLSRNKNRGRQIVDLKDPEVELAIALSKSLQAQIDEETLQKNAFLVEIGLEHEVVLFKKEDKENKLDQVTDDQMEPPSKGRKRRKKAEPKILSKFLTISPVDRQICLANRVGSILEQSSIELEQIESDVNLSVEIPDGISSRLKSSVNYGNRLWNFASSELAEKNKKESTTIEALIECKIRNKPKNEKEQIETKTKIKIPSENTCINDNFEIKKPKKKKELDENDMEIGEKCLKKAKYSIEMSTQTEDLELMDKRPTKVETNDIQYVDMGCQTDDVIIIDRKALSDTKEKSVLFNKTLEEQEDLEEDYGENNFERNRESNGQIDGEDDEKNDIQYVQDGDENKIIDISSDLSFDFGTQPNGPYFTSSPLLGLSKSQLKRQKPSSPLFGPSKSKSQKSQSSRLSSQNQQFQANYVNVNNVNNVNNDQNNYVNVNNDHENNLDSKSMDKNELGPSKSKAKSSKVSKNQQFQANYVNVNVNNDQNNYVNVNNANVNIDDHENNLDWESMDENDLLQVEELEKASEESQNFSNGNSDGNFVEKNHGVLDRVIVEEEPKTPRNSRLNYRRFSSQGHYNSATTTTTTATTTGTTTGSSSGSPGTPVTPMLEYSTIDTPILKQEMKRYGLKPLPRSKAKILLRHIYKQTH